MMVKDSDGWAVELFAGIRVDHPEVDDPEFLEALCAWKRKPMPRVSRLPVVHRELRDACRELVSDPREFDHDTLVAAERYRQQLEQLLDNEQLQVAATWSPQEISVMPGRLRDRLSQLVGVLEECAYDEEGEWR